MSRRRSLCLTERLLMMWTSYLSSSSSSATVQSGTVPANPLFVFVLVCHRRRRFSGEGAIVFVVAVCCNGCNRFCFRCCSYWSKRMFYVVRRISITWTICSLKCINDNTQVNGCRVKECRYDWSHRLESISERGGNNQQIQKERPALSKRKKRKRMTKESIKALGG